MFKKLRSAWMAFVHVLGGVQTTILLSVVYHVAVGPLALVSKVFRQDLLSLGETQDPSYAKALPRISSTLEEAQKQF